MTDIHSGEMPAAENSAWQRFLEQSLAQGGDWRQVARIERVLQLASTGITLDLEAAGYHGTNLGAVAALINSGSLPPGRELGNKLKEGYLHFVPNRAYYLAHSLEIDCASPPEALEAAESYAALSSGRLYLLTELGLSLESELHCAFAEELLASSPDLALRKAAYTQLVSGLGRSIEELETLAQRAADKQGVVLAFSSEILSAFPTSASDDFELGGVRILAENGVPLQMISGIRLLGVEEQEYFARLKLG